VGIPLEDVRDHARRPLAVAIWRGGILRERAGTAKPKAMLKYPRRSTQVSQPLQKSRVSQVSETSEPTNCSMKLKIKRTFAGG
jgi:hypothetical protein